MEIIDISWPIAHTMTTYKDKNDVRVDTVKTFEHDAVRESVLHIGAHTGTHIDAPSHFLKDGITIEQLPPAGAVGTCFVIDVTGIKGAIEIQHLEAIEDFQKNIFSSGQIILFKTTNSNLLPNAPFNKDFVYLAASGAQFLVERKIKAVGIDYLGIERNQPAHDTHTTLMGAGIIIVEGLRLAAAAQGSYFLMCLPLLVHGAEAAPARAILIKH